MTHKDGGDYSNDILGERTGDPAGNGYEWNHFGQMSRYTSHSSGSVYDYVYRGDGMRMSKTCASLNKQWTYAYDGQMPRWEAMDYVAGGSAARDVTRSVLGGRGVDEIERQTTLPSAGSASTVYPLYDGHGNTLAEVSIGSNGYQLGNLRRYDAWGAVRSGDNVSGSHGYCANLGHKVDDESGLIYMRARYYEPSSGRFISEDPARDGINWFSYCDNGPIDRFDSNGKSSKELTSSQLGEFFLFFLGGPALVGLGALFDESVSGGKYGPVVGAFTTTLLAFAWSELTTKQHGFANAVQIAGACGWFVIGLASVAAAASQAKQAGVARAAVYFYAGYSALILGLLLADVLGQE